MFRPKLLFTSLAALALGACSPQDPQAVTSAAIARKPNADASKLVAEARALIAAMPVNETEAAGADLAAAFKGSGGKDKAPRQAELEQTWATFAKEKYAAAQAKAEAALKAAK